MSRPACRILAPLLLFVVLLIALLVVRSLSRHDEVPLGTAHLLAPPGPSPVRVTASSTSGDADADIAPSRPRARTLDVMKLLSAYAQKYRSARKESSAGGILRFCYEEVFHIREARLLALACPGAAEKHATALVLDTTANHDDRRYAAFVLGALAKNGGKSAEDSLYQISCGKEDPIIEETLWMLSEADSQGAYRTLYWTKCREAHLSAFVYAAYWDDDSTRRLFSELAQAPSDQPHPRGAIPVAARHGLEQLHMISSPSGRERFLELLQNPADRDVLWFPWALRAAAAKDLPGLDAILRRRLDAAEAIMVKKGRIGDPQWPDLFVKDGNIAGGADKFFDDVLLAYAERGGKLTEMETRRLRYFGYFCDPMERLLEIVAEHGTDR